MGCGEGEERSEGHFEDTSLTERIRNYEAAIRFLEETDTVDKDRLAAVGSSFGGMVSIAAQNKKMKAVVALSTPYNLQGFDRLYQKQAYHVLPSGSRLKETFFKDLKAYDVLKAVKDAPPILIIHGDKDELVPVEHAYRLYENAKKPKKLEIIESAGHSFYQTKNLCKVAKLSVNWFKKHL
jgi:dipeptidyl aminopeptidase/acylaminoacyl peptidase